MGVFNTALYYLSPLRKKTFVILVCVALFCTYFWDIVAIRKLSRGKKHSHRNPEAIQLNWSWECDNRIDECRRVIVKRNTTSLMSLPTCLMTCNPSKQLWPKPTGGVKIGREVAWFQPRQLKFEHLHANNKRVSKLLSDSIKLFKEEILAMAEMSHTHTTISEICISVNITSKIKTGRFTLNMDESYKLIISKKVSIIHVSVTSLTFLGARHGLETLLQMIWWDEGDRVLKMASQATISDSPYFTYRGLHLDTSRNFIPVSSLTRTIEAMSINKLNIFHWHMTDSQSFPFASRLYPSMCKFGAYSIDEVYSTEDVRKVVDYAEVRGILVLIEIDAPAHAGHGWEWGLSERKGNLTLCLDFQPWSEFCAKPPCGQLNPANENTYNILASLLHEITNLTGPSDILHLGGDEVDLRCWESSNEVSDMEIYANKGMLGVWELFYQELFEELAKTNTTPNNIIMWSNELLDGTTFWKYLNINPPIIQSWAPSISGEIERLLKNHFRVVVSSSDKWYLNNILQWETVYSYRPWEEFPVQEKNLILGGEVCIWTDNVDIHSMDARIWPSAAAFAERMWTDSDESVPNVTQRLAFHRERMVNRGIFTSPLGPKWCYQNPAMCS